MEPFLGEVRLFSFPMIPKNWLPCEGQLLAINQNQALFSLLGTTYGGDGMTTFKLPDLRGRVALHMSNIWRQGSVGGEAAHTLTADEMPKHTHKVTASSAAGTVPGIAGAVWAQQSANAYGPVDGTAAMSPTVVSAAGGSQPHPNMQPYLAVSFCIAIQGIFPTRN